MQTDRTSGAPHERTRPLDVWGRPRGKRTRRNRLDLRGSQPPVTPAQACLAVGRPLRGHGTPLAAGGQKPRGPAWLALGYGVVCAVGGVHAGEAAQLTRDGSVSGRACRGARVHRATGRSLAADAGPCQHGARVCRAGQGGGGRDQRLAPACGHRRWLCRSEPALVRYHRAGVAHWVSQRTGDVAWVGPALWPSPAEAHNPCGAGGRQGAGSGRDDPQIGQRTPPLCQGQAREASGVDPSPHRGGPVGRVHQAHGRTAEAEPRSCHTKCQSDAWGDARGGQAAHPTDRAVDHHRGGGQGHNRPCWCAPGTCHRAQQGRQDGGVWPAVSPESPRWWVYLWDRDLRRGGESKMPLQALAGSRAIFGAHATPTLMVYDRGGYATATLRALAHEGVKEIGIQPKGHGAWHVAEAVRETVRSERGQTEGIIGTLKTDKYGFNKPKERLWQTLEMAGPRSILSFNLNKMMRDLVRAER